MEISSNSQSLTVLPGTVPPQILAIMSPSVHCARALINVKQDKLIHYRSLVRRWAHVSPSNFKSIAKTIGAHYSNDAGAYMLRCPSGYASTPFDFNGFIMNIPLTSFEASYTEDPCVLTVFLKPSTMIRLPESTLQGNSAGKVVLSSFRKTLNGIMDYDIRTY